MAKAVKMTPISAPDSATESHRRSRFQSHTMPLIAVTPNDKYASQADATCGYMMRCASPWLRSGGTTNRAITVIATTAARATNPRMRVFIQSSSRKP
jgi:hypothetical protein